LPSSSPLPVIFLSFWLKLLRWPTALSRDQAVANERSLFTLQHEMFQDTFRRNPFSVYATHVVTCKENTKGMIEQGLAGWVILNDAGRS